ncbi:MAG: hypothetical protein AAGF12_05060 [Myxococcota bacterium]
MWHPAEHPYTYLRGPSGRYLDGAVSRTRPVEIEQLDARNDGSVVVAVSAYEYRGSLLVDRAGATAGDELRWLHPDGHRFLRFHEERAELYDPGEGVVARSESLSGYAGAYGRASLDWSPSGQRLVVGGFRSFFVVDFETGWSFEQRATKGVIHTAAFIDERRVVLLSGGVHVWDVEARTSIVSVEGSGPRHFTAGGGLLVSRATEELLMGGSLARAPVDDPCALVDIPLPPPRRSVVDFSSLIRFVAPDQLLVARPGELHLLRWPTGEHLHTLDTGPIAVECAALSPDGARLVTGGGGILQHFTTDSSQRPIPKPPDFDVWTCASRRVDASGPSTVSELRERVAAMAPFSRLGTSNAPYATSLASLDDWSGPEAQEGGAPAFRLYGYEVAVRLGQASLPNAVSTLGEALRNCMKKAKQAVPYDASEDTWWPANAAVGLLHVTLETVAGFVALGWPLPADLEEFFLWFEAGYWPCGIESTPKGERSRVIVV